MKNDILLIEEGLKLFFRSKKKQFFGTKKYSGNASEICEQIVIDCFNKKNKYFMVSPNNFNQFYARDFGMICESLINLGYKKEVISTIKYAMDKYIGFGRITTQINTRGFPVDFPCWSPESVSYMLNSVILTKDKSLIEKYKPFFKEQARFVYEHAINKKTGLLLKNKNFSSMKDLAKQSSSCYVNCFVGLFAKNLKKIKVKSELDKYDYSALIKKYFWKNDYFVDDLSGNNVASGDANVFPFWTGLVKDKKMFKLSLKKIKEKKLDEPFALKYNNKDDKMKWSLLNFFNTNYEHDTVWLHLAVCYFKVLKNFEEKKELKEQLNKHSFLIEKQKSFYEVYRSNEKPFRSVVFEHDEAMIWCAGFLELIKKH